MSTFTHRGYAASVTHVEDGFAGAVLGIHSDTIAFYSRTHSEAKERFVEAVENYLAVCDAIGHRPEVPSHSL